MASSCEACGLKENASTQKITLLDHLNGFQYNAAKKSDNFVIDMETFSHGAANKDITANSRITVISLSLLGSSSFSFCLISFWENFLFGVKFK